MDLDRYRSLFLEESREHLRDAHRALRALCEGDTGEGLLLDLYRHAHSLKGMALTMGFEGLGKLAHATEDLLGRLRDQGAGAWDDRATLVEESLRCLDAMVDAIESGEAMDERRAEELTGRLLGQGINAPSGPMVTVRSETPAEPGGAGVPLWSIDLELEDEHRPATDRIVALVVGLGRLGRLRHVRPPRLSARTGRFSGRLVVTLASDASQERLEAHLRSLSGIRRVTIIREPGWSGTDPVGFVDPDWIRVRSDLLDATVERTLELLLEHGRQAGRVPSKPVSADHLRQTSFRLRELHRAARQLRLMPFFWITDRLEAAARDVAARRGKRVEVRIAGGDLQVDHGILERLQEPLLHMVRNAIDHGIERPDERRARGKDPRGTLRLAIEPVGNHIRIRVEDDGRGIDRRRLAQVAVERGVLGQVPEGGLSREQACALLTRPSFSTREQADELSGRGVGMDVVRRTVESLGGTIEVDSSEGRGTRFALFLPLTQALVQALVFRCQGELYAVAASFVERALDPRAQASNRDAATRGPRGLPSPVSDPLPENVQVLDFRDVIAAAEDTPNSGTGEAMLLLRHEERSVALRVDEIVGTREILVKPLGEPLRTLAIYSGAALLEDGTIAMVVNPLSVIARDASPAA